MFALNNIDNNFESTVFIDESSIWTFRSGLYHHRRKNSRPRSNCIYPPNPNKIHVWGGISWNGPTPFYLFQNNLDSNEYQRIILDILAPFMNNFNGGNCRFLQDNAPSHVTYEVYNCLHDNNLRWVVMSLIRGVFRNKCFILK